MSHLWFFISFVFLASSLGVDALIPLDLPPFPGQRSELVGSGELRGPEDVAYDPRSNLIYTGCENGWIKLVTVNDSASSSVVRKWVKTGGRPLGIAFGHHREVIVADPKKGLLNITQHREVKVLTVGDEHQKFKLIDSVVVAKNGMIYFTEASYKYNIESYLLDIFEGQPHGRLWSYNPTSKETRVLLQNLYFPNGLALSPDQDFLIFCETTMKRCRKYYTRGKKKRHVEHFIDLPGSPDNIRSVGKGRYLISVVTPSSEDARDFLNETRFGPKTESRSIGGVFLVDAEGNVTARYTDVELSFISSALKVRNYIYCGSLVNLYMVRLDLKHSSI